MGCENPLLESDGLLSQQAVELVGLLTGQAAVVTVQRAIEAMQAANLQRPRKQLTPPQQAALQERQGLMPLFEELGLVADQLVSPGDYRHCLFLGARFVAIAKRIAVLTRARRAGTVLGQMYLLAGKRRLDRDELELVRQLPVSAHHSFCGSWQHDLPETEDQLLAGLYLLAWKPGLPQQVTPVTVDDAAANTAATVEAWIQGGFGPGKVLGVSGPGRTYQQRVLREKLSPAGWPDVSCIAYQSGSTQDVISCIEAFARELQESRT